MLRGLLYYLGFTGETMKYTDSIFYSQPNTNAKLDSIDIKAVQLMYGTKISNGMTVSTNSGSLLTTCGSTISPHNFVNQSLLMAV